MIALSAAERAARQAGYATLVLSCDVVGDAEIVGETFARLADYIGRVSTDDVTDQAEAQLAGRPGVSEPTVRALRKLVEDNSSVGRLICLLAAGETTVQVPRELSLYVFTRHSCTGRYC